MYTWKSRELKANSETERRGNVNCRVNCELMFGSWRWKRETSSFIYTFWSAPHDGVERAPSHLKREWRRKAKIIDPMCYRCRANVYFFHKRQSKRFFQHFFSCFHRELSASSLPLCYTGEHLHKSLGEINYRNYDAFFWWCRLFFIVRHVCYWEAAAKGIFVIFPNRIPLNWNLCCFPLAHFSSFSKF